MPDQNGGPAGLKGKAFIMTGAGGGIGRACALAAAQAGARIVVNDVAAEGADSVVDEIRSAGGQATASYDSVCSWDGSKAMVDACMSAYGKIDGLLNNAGLAHVAEPWAESEQEIRAQVEVNVLGVLYCGRHVMERMRDQRSGSIVNMSSAGAWGIEHMPTYSATKGAVTSATWSWAIDMHPYNVSVNAVSPQAHTIMVRKNWAQLFRQLGYTGPTENRPELRTPASRTATPENVVPIVLYLLSQPPDVSGQFLQIHGQRLSLYRRGDNHLNPMGVTVESDPWTYQAVAAAFEKTFRSQLQPVVDYTKP